MNEWLVPAHYWFGSQLKCHWLREACLHYPSQRCLTSEPATPLLRSLCHFLQSCCLLCLLHETVTSPGQGVTSAFSAGAPALRTAPDTYRKDETEHTAARTSSAVEAHSLLNGVSTAWVGAARELGWGHSLST